MLYFKSLSNYITMSMTCLIITNINETQIYDILYFDTDVINKSRDHLSGILAYTNLKIRTLFKLAVKLVLVFVAR